MYTKNINLLNKSLCGRKTKNYLGFTLVELIVVITILVILGTIAFVNIGGYSGSARDSVRISNLVNLHKGLSLFNITSGVYPMPDNAVSITASGTSGVIGYQGYAKDLVGNIVKISLEGVKDPLDDSMYTTYSVNRNQTKMQVMGFLEDGSNISTFVPSAYAGAGTDYSKRYPITRGDTLGILLSTATGTLNQPLQETSTGVDIVSTNSGFNLYFTSKDTLSGTGFALGTPLQINMNNGGSGFNAPTSCPSGFIPVPGNKEFSQPGFCVAKYEMSYDETTPPDVTGGTEWNTRKYNASKTPVSMAGRLPVTEITQSGAIESCQKLGAGYHLITNNEWMTVARNIEANPVNWSNGITGSGYIANGVSNDTNAGCGGANTKSLYPNAFNGLTATYLWATTTGEGGGNPACDTKRQLRLSNGQIIWDLAGNLMEQVNKGNTLDTTNYNDANSWKSDACSGVNNWAAFSDGSSTDGVNTCSYSNNYSYSNIGPKIPNLNANNGIGRIYLNSAIINNVFIRGGAAYLGVYDGVFIISLAGDALTTSRDIGFRCAR